MMIQNVVCFAEFPNGFWVRIVHLATRIFPVHRPPLSLSPTLYFRCLKAVAKRPEMAFQGMKALLLRRMLIFGNLTEQYAHSTSVSRFCATRKYSSNRRLFPCLNSLISTRGKLREFDIPSCKLAAKSRLCITVENSSNSSSVR